MKWTLTLFLLLGCFLSYGQDSVEGCWKGIITQSEGGFRKNYQFEMYLQQNGSVLKGRSYVYFEDFYAEMSLKGTINSENEIIFSEQEIVDYRKLEGMEWCIKSGLLRLRKDGPYWKLHGTWSGDTHFGNCFPGKIFLEKIEPQA